MKKHVLPPEEQFMIAYELQEEQIEPSDGHVRAEIESIPMKPIKGFRNVKGYTREDLMLVYRIAMSYAHTIVHEDALERKWRA